MKVSKAHRIIPLVLGAVLLLSGCSRSDGGSAAAAEGLHVEVRTEPAVVQAKEPARFLVQVTDHGKLVAQANVSLYLEMRDMDHGENVIALSETSPGDYRGTGSFPMAGDWVAHVRIKREAGTESKNVELTVSE